MTREPTIRNRQKQQTKKCQSRRNKYKLIEQKTHIYTQHTATYILWKSSKAKTCFLKAILGADIVVYHIVVCP